MSSANIPPKSVGIQTAVQQHGQVEDSFKEVYGKGNILLRIGNGGAGMYISIRAVDSTTQKFLGATGLLKALAIDYLSTIQKNYSIAWVCNHSRNSLLALNYGFVDVTLTYERDQEALAAAEGWALIDGCVFHDHFCLAGPVSDPASVMLATDMSDALQRISRHESLFQSRADGSATTWKERDFWSHCGLSPWELKNNEHWYKMASLSPADALAEADKAGAYLLIDRSTLLRQVMLQKVTSTTVFLEPQSSDDILMNSCYALHPRAATTEQLENVQHFIDYVLSPRGQSLIGSYGILETGLALFAPVAEGCAKTLLRGGAPSCGKWKPLERK